ncbi:hypothetical protein ACQP2P_15525 [Dactylosporangium sp. CA-139114]|uniref:hypothetical protein n=1 Tax=Dactylosporangium sp. CA-139114 TaxID=3239931 RepID=UPI003D9550D9
MLSTGQASRYADPPHEIVASIAVMSHPQRSTYAQRVVGALGGANVAIAGLNAGKPSAENAYDCAIEAWRSVAPGATHHVVLQDDVMPCPDFMQILGEILAADPDRCFCLFSEWASLTGQSTRLAAFLGHRWAPVVDAFVPAPAVLLPAQYAPRFADFLADRFGAGETRDAFLLSQFLTACGVTPYVVTPNLVEHDTPVLPSLLPNGKVRGPRRSACFAGDLAPRDRLTTPGTTLSSVPELPYHSRDDLVAYVLTATGARGEWTRRPAFAWLAERGWTAERLAAARPSEATDPRSVLGPDLRYEFWLGALATGLIMRDQAGDSFDVESRLAHPAAALALRTMATGPLRRVLTETALQANAEDLALVLGDGIRRAFQE